MSTARSALLLASVLLVALGGLLRLVGLEHNPPGLWQDEASTGLDAYLIWHTGRDRAGAFFPLIARSFGDYPLALYRYLTAPVVGLFGLSPGNERIAAAASGTILIALTGAAVRRRYDGATAVAVMLSAALCPTWVHFSRYGSEAILLPTLLAGAWAAIEHAHARRSLLWVGVLLLALSAYTYHAVKIVLPIWIIGFLWLEWPILRDHWRSARHHLTGAAVLFALLVLPSFVLAFSDGGMARGRTVLAPYRSSGLDLWRMMAGNYLSYFDPGMLFVRGGPAAAQSIPGLGLWNLIELPLMILGLATGLREAHTRRSFTFVLFWFLLGPLPGGITYETQNVGRAIAWLPAPQILSGTGLVFLVRWALARRAENPRGAWIGSATLAALASGWAVTAASVVYLTLVEYPRLAERDFQSEISRAMACAREELRAGRGERFVVSPAFQVASVFAAFHLGDLDGDGPDAPPRWELGERTVVRPGEIYVFPASRPKPEGERLCEITHPATGEGVAYAYGPEVASGGAARPW